jgi:cold shock protein
LSEAEKQQGKVKWFDSAKGYGFIQCDSGEDVFVHYSDIESAEGEYKTLAEGDSVEFELAASPKGAKAASVVKL